MEGVHVQKPVPLNPVAAGADVRQVLLPGGGAEPSLQRDAVLLGVLHLLGGEQVLPETFPVLVSHGHVHVLPAVPAVGGPDGERPQRQGRSAPLAGRLPAQQVVGVDLNPSLGQFPQSRLDRQGCVQGLVPSPASELPFRPEMYLNYLNAIG